METDKRAETMGDKIIVGGLTVESLDRFHRIEARSFARYGHCLFDEIEKGEAEERYVSRLAAHIREYLTIRDIIDFNGYANFITLENYLSANKHVRTLDWVGKDWRITSAGYVADTAEKQRAIIRLFAEIGREAIFFIGIKMYAEKCAPPPHLWDQFNADADEESPLDMTLNALIRSCPANAERCLNDLKDMEKRIFAKLDAQGADMASTRTGVAFLVNDRKGKIKGNRKRGAENQAKGIDAERERAAKDMDDALDRVRRRIADAEKNGKRAIVLDACRAVCKEFKWKTKKKNALGKCADGYYPLTGADGKPIKPETLAKNYRDRYGGKRGKREKAVAAK